MQRNSGYCSIIGDMTIRLLAYSLLAWLLTGTALSGVLENAQEAYKRADFQKVLMLLEQEGNAEAEALLLLGKAHYQLGNFDEAAKAMQRAIDKGGESAARRNWLGRALGMQAERANPFSALGLARKARDEFQKAVALDARNLEAVSDLFSFYLAAPGFLGGGMDKARELAETVKPLDTAEYAGMRAQIAEKEKDYAGAEQWLRRAMAAAPTSVGRYVDLARFYTRRGVIAKADAAFHQAKALQPTAPRLLFNEADLLVRSNRNPARARRLLEEYQRSARTPDDPSPFETAQLIGRLEKLEKESRRP